MEQDLGVAAEPCEQFIPRDITIPVGPLLRIQGYRDLGSVRDDVRSIAEDMAACAESLLAPEAYYRRLRIDTCTNGTLVLETGTVFHSMELTRTMADCRELVAFVITLGPGLDDKSEALLKDSDVVEALFLETAGWVAIERATKALAQHLWSVVSDPGLSLGRRLGPGYADWSLDDQRPLFSLFDGAPLPIRLLDSCAMTPKKSRSGVYGLRSAA